MSNITLTLTPAQFSELSVLLVFANQNFRDQQEHVLNCHDRQMSQAFDDYLSCIISKAEFVSMRRESTEICNLALEALKKNHLRAESALLVLTAAGVATPGDNAHPEQPAAGLFTGFHTTFSTESVDNV